MSDYLGSTNLILNRMTGNTSSTSTSSTSDISAANSSTGIYSTLEDELVELCETSDIDYESLLSDSATIEDIEQAIEEKQEELIDKQTETKEYINECKEAIQEIFANGTDIIPEEVQENYNTELENIESGVSDNTGTIQENLSVVTENTIAIKKAENETEEKEKEIEEKQEEIDSLQNEENPDSDKIAELEDEIEDLNLEITNLQSTISNAEKNIATAESENDDLQEEISGLTQSQGSLMSDLMDDYYSEHTEEDRIYEDSELKSQIEALEDNIQTAISSLSTNTIKLSSEIETLTQIMALKTAELEAESSAAASSTAAASSSSVSSESTYSGDLIENTELAEAAEAVATELNTTGRCLGGVNTTLNEVYGFTLSYASAYQALPELQSRSDFTEVTDQYPSASDLTNLPAGAIVVWENSSSHPHGHISIALGDGREASDHIQSQTTNYGTQYHVFIKTS